MDVLDGYNEIRAEGFLEYHPHKSLLTTKRMKQKRRMTNSKRLMAQMRFLSRQTTGLVHWVMATVR